MSLFDNAIMYGADTVKTKEDGRGFLDAISTDAPSFIASAVVSGLSSIYNTAAVGINALGGDVEQLDTLKALESLDERWAEMYSTHKDAADITGFIVTSLLPGGLFVKGLKAAQAGNTSSAFARSLNFAKTKQAQALDRALAEMAVEGGTVFTRINKNKLATMGWAYADQAITAAAFETGVALTMNQSPLFADDDWWDITKTALVGVALGGVVGGAVDSLILNSEFKTAVKALNKTQRDYDWTQQVSGLNLKIGDKATGLLNNLLKLPKEIAEDDKLLKMSFSIANKKASTKFVEDDGLFAVDITQAIEKSIKTTERTALLDFERTLKQLATDAPDITEPFAHFVLEEYSKLLKAGKSPEVIRERLGDYLENLTSLRAAPDAKVSYPRESLVYFNSNISKEALESIKTADDWKNLTLSHTPFKDSRYSKPLVWTGTQEELLEAFQNIARVGNAPGMYPTVKAAFESGAAVVLKADATLAANISKGKWRRVNDPIYSKEVWLNTRTGVVSDSAVLTAADSLPAKSELKHLIQTDAVYLKQAGQDMKFSMTDFVPDGNSLYYTARHAWASQHATDEYLSRLISIDIHDFSLLDKLAKSKFAKRSTEENDTGLSISITKNQGKELVASTNEVVVEDFVAATKNNFLMEAFKDAFQQGITLDIRELAYRVNLDPRVIEELVAKEFVWNAETKELIKKGTRKLDSYLYRENLVAKYNTTRQLTALTDDFEELSFAEKRAKILEDTAKNGGSFVTGELAWHYRVQQAVRATKNAASAVLGSERASKLVPLAQTVAKTSDTNSVGSTTLGFSNANYGDTLRAAVQDIGKHVHHWIGENVDTVVVRLGAKAQKLRQNSEAAADLGIVTNLLRTSENSFKVNPVAPLELIDSRIAAVYKKHGVTPEGMLKASELQAALEAEGVRTFIKFKTQDAYDFFLEHMSINSRRVNQRTTLANSRGVSSNKDPEIAYAPAVDTGYFKHFVFVRPKEGKIFGTSEVAMIFGRDAEELSKRVAAVDSKLFDVITKDQTEAWFKAKDLYEFDRTINSPTINSELKRTGALSSLMPEMRAENLLEDYMRWHQRQETQLVRDAVETHYAQQFEELRKLGEQYTSLATSQFSGILKITKSAVNNPFEDYIKTALDVSKRSEYKFFSQLNEFIDAVGTRAYRVASDLFGDASKGIVSWEKANSMLEAHGIKGPLFKNAEDFFLANTPRDRNIIKEYVAKANMLLANFVLRFDMINSLMNIVSTPLLLSAELASIKTLVSKDSELTGALNALTKVKVPGQDLSVPSTVKLLANALSNFAGEKRQDLLARYIANGDIKTVSKQYHEFLSSLDFNPDFKIFSDNVNKAFDTAAKFSFNEYAETLTRFVSADVMRQLTEPLVQKGAMSLAEQNAYISIFVNRVQGNYISSQRPIIFQGTTGAAISLFQTYSFTLLQQLFRHIGNKDKRAVATMYGMQASLFGLNGTPFFDAVNTHIIGNAAVNDGHYDAYSLAPQLLGKEVGDWLMYGTASAFPAWSEKAPALYTRGDINPRHMTILPMTPQQIPAIDASIRFVRNLVDVGSKLMQGADVSTTLLQGLEHNGINRPLAGIAQVMQGQSSTSKGSLISAATDFDLIATAGRIAGAKPMDEAVALNQLYRMKAYQAADLQKRELLGEAVKTYLYKNQMPPIEVLQQFQKDYAASGGRIENFNASLQRWMRDANVSVIEQMRAYMNTPYAKRLNEIMGGVPLEDYRNSSQEN